MHARGALDERLFLLLARLKGQNYNVMYHSATMYMFVFSLSPVCI